MTKRVFIIHGWDGYSEEGWFPWLKKELEQNGFEVFVPQMPEPSAPIIDKWVNHLAKAVNEPDKNTYFVGHSIGCQTILRYLEILDNKKVGGAVFVAPWFILGDLETEEEKIIGKPWIATPINFKNVKAAASNFVCIFSEDDPIVPLDENVKLFEQRINPKIIMEHGKGHFSGSDGITELPSVLNSVLELARK